MHFNVIKKDLVLTLDEIEVIYDVDNKTLKKTKNKIYYELREKTFDLLYNAFHLDLNFNH